MGRLSVTERDRRVADVFTELRLRRDIRQRDVANALNKQRLWLSRIENYESRLTCADSLLLCEYFGVDLNYVNQQVRSKLCAKNSATVSKTQESQTFRSTTRAKATSLAYS